MTERRRHRGAKWDRFSGGVRTGEPGRECESLINDHTAYLFLCGGCCDECAGLFSSSHCCTDCKFCSNPTQFNEAGSTGSYSTTLPLTQVTFQESERESVCEGEGGGEGSLGERVEGGGGDVGGGGGRGGVWRGGGGGGGGGRGG